MEFFIGGCSSSNPHESHELGSLTWIQKWSISAPRGVIFKHLTADRSIHLSANNAVCRRAWSQHTTQITQFTIALWPPAPGVLHCLHCYNSILKYIRHKQAEWTKTNHCLGLNSHYSCMKLKFQIESFKTCIAHVPKITGDEYSRYITACHYNAFAGYLQMSRTLIGAYQSSIRKEKMRKRVKAYWSPERGHRSDPYIPLSSPD